MNSTKHVHVKNTGSGFVKTSTAKYSMNTERLVSAFCDHKENLMVVLFTFPYGGDFDTFHGLCVKNIYQMWSKRGIADVRVVFSWF